MASLSPVHGQRNEPHIPGLPGPNKLGASKSEVIALGLATLALVLITLSFWFSATR